MLLKQLPLYIPEFAKAGKADLTIITDQMNTSKETGWKQKIKKLYGKIDLCRDLDDFATNALACDL